MKKQYVYGYGNEKKSSKEKYTAVFLVGMCIAAALITFLVVGISKKINKTNSVDYLIESKQDENVRVVSEDVNIDSGIEEENTAQASSDEAILEQDEENFETNPSDSTLDDANPETPEIIDDEKYTLPCNGKIIYEFSPTVPIYSETLDDWRVHNGIDIYAPLGAEVCCIADGVVHSVTEDFRFGYTVVVEHSDGMRSVYSNLDSAISFKEGDKIMKGSVLARVGDTALFETVADTHLHFEMLKNGNYVNPTDYLSLR